VSTPVVKKGVEGAADLFARQEAALESWGAAAEVHSVSSLLEHLRGTRDVLASWGCSPALCAAGFFHSVYGTESFWGTLKGFDERDAVRAVCGREAEEIVYLFSAMTRDSFDASLRPGAERRIRDRHADTWCPLPPDRHRDLCLLSAANWLEQIPRLPVGYLELGRERSGLLLAHLPEPARGALGEIYPG
jgi:hypothetical protein